MIATSILHSVGELCVTAFSYLGLDYQEYIRIDPKFYRPAEDVPLVGNPSKARQKLGWKPEEIFDDMIKEMVDFEIAEARKVI